MKSVETETTDLQPIRVARAAPVSQNYPTVTLVSHLGTGDELVTAIYRKWPVGDGNAVRHRNCFTCMDMNGKCLIQARGFVSCGDAPLFNADAFERRK